MLNQNRDILNELNPSQRAAVQYNGGPSLVIAGAGSGKTRVLTYKIAFLMQQGMRASNILALTFTNKAAREMRSRIADLVDPIEARYLWMGTFHSIFARILRTHANLFGYNSDYTIYDTADSKSMVRAIIKQMELDEKTYKVNTVLSRISEAKNRLLTPQMYMQDKDCVTRDRATRMYKMGDIYFEYMRRCHTANALDFDDLLYQTAFLFKKNPDILAFYQDQFKFILVDEYQDTNFAQYVIISMLADSHQNICVVGDDAQSIYSFRGADIRNILNFRNKYPTAKEFRLERNYRSTQNIVEAANSVIRHNANQLPKDCYSENEHGELLHVLQTSSDREEARKVVAEISRRHRYENVNYDDIAILYRTNAQSRVLEEAFRDEGIPYRIYGGHSFYQRKEIKDAIAYMRLSVNKQDDESLKRIINVPARGLGDTTLNKILDAAHAHNCSAWEVLAEPEQHHLQVNKGTLDKLQKFKNLIEFFTSQLDQVGAADMTKLIIEHSGMEREAREDQDIKGESRLDNLHELVSAIKQMEEKDDNPQEKPTIREFLADISLQTDQDEDDKNPGAKVTMMTIHAAKGLEFRIVFITGMEENLFPNQMVQNDEHGLEEERRLLYVAITRAKEICYLSYASLRYQNGKAQYSMPSSFMDNIEPRYLDQSVAKNTRNNCWSDFDLDNERSSWGNWGASGSTTRTSYQRPAQSASHKLTSLGVRLKAVKTEPEAPVSSPTEISFQGLHFAIGDRLEHTKMGRGTVVEIDLMTNALMVKMDRDNTTRKFLLSFALKSIKKL